MFEDETDLRLFPPLRSAWAPLGQPTRVEITGHNAKRVVFGSINIRTGKRLFLVAERQKAEDFAMYLEYVRSHYRGWHVVMFADEHSSHTADLARQTAKILDIEIIFLPKRAPELNPMEALWGDAKDAVCANRQYGSIDDVTGCFIAYLETLSNSEALRKAGLLSKSF